MSIKNLKSSIMIKQIIQEDLIEIYFQPIVSIRTKKIYAFEALTRCSYQNQNFPPDILFNLARDENLLMQLDELTRNKAIEKFNSYYQENNDLVLFLNFESSLINNIDYLLEESTFIKTISNLEIPYENFVLEIKEDEISSLYSLNKFCDTYKKLGFSIALDDFGTGSSTFHRINLIRPDLIKIDKSLFEDVKNNQINKEIVKAISKMSHNLGIRVLAEGVEDENAICLGMKSSINLFQGYYFSKPKNEISYENEKKIIEKINKIGKLFKDRNISGINKKREVIEKYELIANEMVDKIQNIEESYGFLKKKFEKYLDIEAIYLIDANSSKQINDTILNINTNKMFRPTKQNDEHYLKEYFYITLESKRGIYLSQKYISYATGNICKTFAKKFIVGNTNFILCLDIVIEGG